MKKTVITICICLISLLLLIIVKDQYSPVLLKNADFGMPALIKKGEIDNLFIGSSAFRQGLDIDVLEEELPGSSYIITYNGNQPVFEYIQLKKLIDSGVKIRNLYVDMYAYTLCRKPGLDDEKMLMELDIAEKSEIYRMLSDKSPKLFYETYVSSNNEQILTWPVNKRILNTQFKDGGTLVHTEGLSPEEYDSISPSGSDGVINEDQQNALSKIIGLCRDNEIKLTFIETPKAYNITQDETYMSIMDRYAGFLDDNGVHYIRYTENMTDGNDILSDSTAFADGIHLSSPGRAAFTAQIVERIQ